MPRVSVVIPYHRSQATIAATLESVARQTFHDFEVVVVDDGSPEPAAPLVEPFRDRLPGFRLVEQPNGKVAAARNAGIAATSGRYVAPLDADDLWHPTYLEMMVARLEETGAVNAYSPCRLVDTAGNATATLIQPRVDGWAIHRLMARNFVYTGSSFVYLREAGDRFGHFDPAIPATCDYLIQARLLVHGTMATVPRYLVGYRQVPGSYSRNARRMATETRRVYELLGDAFPSLDRRTLRRGLAGYMGVYARSMWPHDRRYALHLLSEALLADPVSVAVRMFGRQPARPTIVHSPDTPFWSLDPASTPLLEPGDPLLRRDFLDAERLDAQFAGLP
ncbi:MAG TPA: glycosyltransferase family 2 protein [Devosia sp.]|nr:glycosyltransferase family 2 protein [Devosia sp.]